MPQRVILDGLWCGQGMANMIRIYNDTSVDPETTACDELCIFDFGSGGLSQTKKVLGITPPVEFMMKQLRMQNAAGRTPHIDLMLISHQDRDHWRLLSELNQQIIDSGMTVTVGNMLLGGLNWRESSERGVNAFAKRANDIYWYDGQFSSFSEPPDPGDPIEVGDLKMRMLVTNVAASNVSDDIERNCSSSVALLQLGPTPPKPGIGFILPGDSTWETFEELQEIMTPWAVNPLPIVYSASVPHHGALRTMNRNNSVTTPDLQDLIWFTNYTRPYSVFASAGIKNTHSHPYLIVLETMGLHAGTGDFQQRPIVFFDRMTSDWDAREVVKNIYTTVLNLGAPAQTANWSFNITPDTASTSIQLFEAGVPGIFSAPQINEMQLAAQRRNDEMVDTNMDIDTEMFDDPHLPFRVGRVQSGPAIALAPDGLQPPPAAPPAEPPPRAPVAHRALPTAGALQQPIRRTPPPRRVRASDRSG